LIALPCFVSAYQDIFINDKTILFYQNPDLALDYLPFKNIKINPLATSKK